MTELLRGTPDATVAPPPSFVPRPAPSGAELLRRELAHRARATAGEARAVAAALRGGEADVAGRARAVAQTLVTGLRPAADVPLNAPTGSPHRRVDWMAMPLDDLKAVKNRLGGTVNDVVIAAIAGALGRYLDRLGAAAGGAPVRALLPVNVRGAGERGRLGNRVALLLAELPTGERDARRRLERVRAETGYLKERSHMADSTELLVAAGDALAPALVNQLVRLTVSRRTFNVVITNIPGPPFPLYLLGSRLEAVYPVPPIYPNQRVAFAVFSQAGQVYWTIFADRDAPELHELLGDVRAAFDELAAA
jgi:WS/DGAT/MGAT family acyltransferase